VTPVSAAGKHPIIRIVFTAITVVVISAIPFYTESLITISDLKLVPVEGENGGLGKNSTLTLVPPISSLSYYNCSP
jgi:hypothetical protein